MLRPALIAVALLSLAGAALAEEHADKKGKPDDRTVDVSNIAAPIVWRGRLVNYVFISTRLKVGPTGDVDKLRAKEPYFRDALVRAAHRTPFTDPRDFARVDERAVTTALLREAQKLEGPRAFLSAEVVSQAPRQRAGLPKPDGPPAPQGRALTP